MSLTHMCNCLKRLEPETKKLATPKQIMMIGL